MCAQLDASLTEARGYGIDRAGVHLVYLKGAIRRELAWHGDVRHYLSGFTTS
jgi:hypothetical protein